MGLKQDDIDWARRQTKSRQRPRSTVFDDGVDKADRRQQRRLSEKKLIDEEYDLELDENEHLDDAYYDGYWADRFNAGIDDDLEDEDY